MKKLIIFILFLLLSGCSLFGESYKTLEAQGYSEGDIDAFCKYTGMDPPDIVNSQAIHRMFDEFVKGQSEKLSQHAKNQQESDFNMAVANSAATMAIMNSTRQSFSAPRSSFSSGRGGLK